MRVREGQPRARQAGKQAYDTGYPGINRGLEGLLSLTVKNDAGRRRSLSVSTKIVSDLKKARMVVYGVNIRCVRFTESVWLRTTMT